MPLFVLALLQHNFIISFLNTALHTVMGNEFGNFEFPNAAGG